MTSSRKTALVVGVLFILTFITSIGAAFAYGPVLTDPHYVTGAGADTRVFLGAALELFLIITNIGCAIVLFPMLKRQNEGLALGYVAARIVECTFILIGILSLLAIVTLRQGGVGADAGSLVAVDRSFIAVHNWTFLLGPGFVDGIGTGLTLGWLLYRSGLVSRRMALFGVIGGPLLALSGLAVLLGVIPTAGSVQHLMTAPSSSGRRSWACGSHSRGSSRSPATPPRPSTADRVRALRSMRSSPPSSPISTRSATRSPASAGLRANLIKPQGASHDPGRQPHQAVWQEDRRR